MINTVGRQNKADLCYDTVERLFCEDLTRGVNPNTPGATQALISVNDQLLNVAAVNISGVDVDIGYGFGLGGDEQFGRLRLHLIGTFYDKADQTPRQGDPTEDYLGYAGGSDVGPGLAQAPVRVGHHLELP